MLTPDAVQPFSITEQSPERLVLTGRSQVANGTVVVVCSLALGVIVSWGHPTFLSAIALLPVLLFRILLSLLPAVLVITPGQLEIRFRGFLSGSRSEFYPATEIKQLEGLPHTFRGHFASVRLIRSNGMSKKIFSGPRGSRALAEEHSSLISAEFSKLLGLRAD
jgi:hypothetical protein